MSRPRAIALLERQHDEVFARYAGRDITAGTFLTHVAALGDKLPAQSHVFNLLRDRYEFTVAFAAIMAAGKCNVLPASPRPGALTRLAQQLPDAAIIHDGLDQLPDMSVINFDLPADPAADAVGGSEIPQLDPGQLAALTFTSGSSGTATPVRKSVRTLRGAATIYEDALLPKGCSITATVPAQHMYGLELGSLQAFWSPVRFSAGKPLFPADVQAELEETSGTRVLVTTPLHLRALVESGLEFPQLSRVLCATAPLESALAQQAERMLAAPILDVYGCSEAGCLATRRVATTQDWTPLPGFSFYDEPAGEQALQEHDESSRTLVNAGHLEAAVPLSDRLELSQSGQFHLAGRLGDMINVAGKRGSLGEITRLMLEVPGVTDAAALLPGPAVDNQRPAALFTGSADIESIRQRLGEVLDPVFIPRPLLRVDALPRTSTSKLPRDALLACFQQARQQQ